MVMRRIGQGRWFCGLLVTGLFVAAVLHAPGEDSDKADRYGAELAGQGTDLAKGTGEIPIKKSGFFFTEYMATEVARLQSPDGTGDGQGSTAVQANPISQGIRGARQIPEGRETLQPRRSRQTREKAAAWWWPGRAVPAAAQAPPYMGI